MFWVILVLCFSCVEPYEIETDTFEDFLVVEALLTDAVTFQEIKLGWGVIKYGYAKKIYDILFEKVQYEPFFLINKSKYFEK